MTHTPGSRPSLSTQVHREAVIVRGLLRGWGTVEHVVERAPGQFTAYVRVDELDADDAALLQRLVGSARPGQSNKATDPNLSRARSRVAQTDVRTTGDTTPDPLIDVDRSNLDYSPIHERRPWDTTSSTPGRPDAHRDFHVGDVVTNKHSGDRLRVTTTGTWESRFYQLEHCPHRPIELDPQTRRDLLLSTLKREARAVLEGDDRAI